MLRRDPFHYLRWAALACVIVGGCTGQATESRPKRVPVTGTVFFKNAPVEGATVVFHPQDHPHAAASNTQANGAFQMRTFDPGDGAVPGEFKVTVRKFHFVGDTEIQDLPKRYGYPQSSKLTVTVKEEGSNEFRFELVD